VATARSVICAYTARAVEARCGTTTLHVHAVLAAPVFEQRIEGAAETVRRWERPAPASPK
jgi:hypothetical protein